MCRAKTRGIKAERNAAAYSRHVPHGALSFAPSVYIPLHNFQFSVLCIFHKVFKNMMHQQVQSSIDWYFVGILWYSEWHSVDLAWHLGVVLC